MTKDEALKLALEALKQCNIYAFAGGLGVRAMEHTEAMEAIKEALEQPEPFNPDWASYRQGKEDGQREWVGLTGDDRDNIARVATDVSDAMLLIEAKLKELNHV